MTRVIDNTVFPSAMEVKLRQIRGRQAGLAVVRAVALAGSVLIVTMLVAMLADWWFTLFDTSVRTALTVSSVSLAIAVFLMVGVRPVIEALGWTRAANKVDAEVPQLEERWTTISHIARSTHQPNTKLSKAMLQQVTSEAVALGELVHPARVVRVARLRKVLLVGVASGAALAGFLAVNWEQNSVLLRRFWAPTASITATQLESLTGDAAIPRGQAIDIVTRLTGLQRATATLTLVTDSEESSTMVLDVSVDSPETFTHIVDVDESFRYRVRAGDGQTEWHSITAIDPPEISEVRLTVTAPEYVDRPPYEKTLLPGRVKAIQGSRLTLEMRCESKLQRFELMLASNDESGETIERALQLKADSDGWYRFETVLEQDLALSPTLVSPYGLTNEDRRICRVRVIPDKAPVARVISPTEDMTVSPDEVLDIRFEAHDDHGIAKAELIVYEENDEGEQEVLTVQEIPLDDQQLDKHILASTKLDLSQFDLEQGKNIAYAVRVTDNRMLNLDPDDVPSRTSESSKSPNHESENADRETMEAMSIAQANASTETAENEPAPDATASAREDEDADSEGSDSSKTDKPAPDGKQVAKADVPAGPKQPPQEATSPSGATEPGETPDSTEATAESGKEGLRVADDEKKQPTESAVAKADANGEQDKSDQEKPAILGDPQTVAADSSNSPMPAADAESTADAETTDDERVAASEGDQARKSESGMPPEGDDKPESPRVAAPGSKPAEDVESQDANPAGGSSNPQSQPGTAPQLAQSGNGSPRDDAEKTPPENRTAEANEVEPDETKREPRRPSGSIQLSEAGQSRSGASAPPLDLERDMKFESQRGQNTESNRMRLRIADRLAVAAEAGKSRRSDAMNTREQLKKIDKQLEAAETTLLELNDRPGSSELSDKSRQVDSKLESAESVIANLRNDSKETKYEFVGLQMLDIGRTHLTPSRDRMFMLIQDPGLDPARNILKALHHTSAVREALATLTRRFEEVARERELAEALEEIAKIYEVYVENVRGVLREAQENQNPLRRKMAVVEVDDAYLERLTQVLEMEQEIMAEFARILSDDPRLMGKYMDMIKRRDGNLRNRLTGLRELQEEIAYEVSGWLRVDEAQRPDVWIQVAEMRLVARKDLVKAASQLEARTLSQLPLNLNPDGGIGGQIVRHAKEVSLKARQSSLKATKLMNDAFENDQVKVELTDLAEELKFELTELDAMLERLAFERDGDETVTDFSTRRLAESRGVAELAIAWAEVVSQVQQNQFHGLAAVDQQRLAVDTDRLRIDMETIENGLTGLFRPDDVPADVTNIARELMMVMETITFNQAAATFELTNGRLEAAEAQQTMASEGFARAEELFDKMRRTTVEILDEREVDNPNVANLEDPTLDEFLERLEREPNLNQLLGIPNRPSNLRVIRDWMLWRAQGNGMGGAGEAANAAMQRAKLMAQQRNNKEQKRRQAATDRELTEEEMRKFAQAEDMEEEMEKMLRAIEEKMKDPSTDAKQREELQKKAQMLAQMLEEARSGGLDREKWEELANADETRAMMEALARGEPIPDSQWNRLLSTLDAGLWQVRGRTPPEDYRKAIDQYQDQIRRLLNAESIDAN